MGGILSQNGFVVFYESRKLKDHEKNCATHELELASIVQTLKKWRNCLMGRRSEMRTDHKDLKYLFGHPSLNARQSIWLELLCNYDFDIKHINGKENKVANVLSRRVHELHATTISMYQTDIKGRILEATNADLKYMELVLNIQ